jgi:nucleoside-diphosphate-sugar epimerase
MNRCIVTGATGFLGSYVSRRLHYLGYEVIATGRDATKGEKLEADGIKFRRGDLSDKCFIDKLVKQGDNVFHCGAMSTLWGRYEDFFRANVEGTRNIAQSSLENKARRFIHVSTPAIYFNFQDRLNVREDEELPSHPANLYAKTKRMGEEVIDKLYSRGLPVITIRPRGIFGVGDNAILPRLIRANKKGIPFIRDGKALTDITHVENVVDALVLCQNADDNLLGEKYNITNGQPIPIGELVTKVFSSLGIPLNRRDMNYYLARGLCEVMEFTSKYITHKEPLLSRYSLGLFANNETLCIEKARRDLGYKPRVSIEEGIEQFSREFKEHGF